MERSINGAAAPARAPDRFVIKDSATGKMRAVREMTDQELAKITRQVQDEMPIHKQAKSEAAVQLAQAEAAMHTMIAISAVVDYEIDRRAKSIIVVP